MEANIKCKIKNYRLNNNDFFTKSKLLKFKTTDSADCKRCGAEKSRKQDLWDCPFSQLAWKNLNSILEEKKIRFGQNSFL
jgi:hypothetical protein